MRQYLPSRTLLQHSAPSVSSFQSPDQPSPLPVSRDDAAPSSSAASPESPDLDSHISPSMAIIMVVLLTAFFFMGFFSVYLKRCTTQQEISSNNRAAATRRQPPEQGLDPAVLESLPMLFYSTVKTTREGKELTECSVCLNEFEDNEPLRLLPKCRHYFHPECIDMWLSSHTTCPLCRRSLLERLGSFRWPGWGSLRGSRSVQNEDSHDDNPTLATEGGEARVTLDNRIAGIDQARNLNQLREGVSSARSWRRGQNLNDVEARRIHDSAILGLMKSASTSSPYKGRTRFRSELRRSRSTGHSLVKRVLSRASLFLPGSSLPDNLNEGQPLSSSLPLEASGRAGLRRSKSHAMLSRCLSGEEEEDGSCSRWSKRSSPFKRACSLRRSPKEVMASNMGELASSPGSRRTFERLVVIDL